MNKTAAAYIRVSDERQSEFSPDSQLKLIREYCARNDIELPDELIFYDDGISAKTAAKRPEFNRMIALAKSESKPFQMILVWKFSRFTRNQEEAIVYKSMLRKNGVDVVSVSEPSQDNPFSGLIERVIEWMDEYYLIRLSDEVVRGMTERAQRGLPNVAPPFGYRMQNGEYVIKEDEAEIVRMIFEMFCAEPNLKKIATTLNSMGVKNQYNHPFDNRAIEYILNNPCYIGYVRWNPNGKSASARIYDNPDDILRRSTHDPIISEEIFEKAKGIFEMRKATKRKYERENFQKNVYMLKGLVKCHSCGSTLVYTKDGLQCHQYSHGVCPTSHYVSLNKINKMVIQELKNAIETMKFNISVESHPAPTTPPIDYEKLISAERLKLDRAKQAYQEGVDSLQEYKAAKSKIEKQIAKLQEDQQNAAVESADLDLSAFASTVASVLEIIESPDVSEELKHQALKTIIKKFIFYRPENKIDIFFYA